MYKGKKTLFYNGEKLMDKNCRPIVYNENERNSWKVIIILPGVKVVPVGTFYGCNNVQAVIMADTVLRIDGSAFSLCKCLVFIKLSRNLEYIGVAVFDKCESLTSLFIPPSCREIGEYAFSRCDRLIILQVPQQTFVSK